MLLESVVFGVEGVDLSLEELDLAFELADFALMEEVKGDLMRQFFEGELADRTATFCIHML